MRFPLPIESIVTQATAEPPAGGSEIGRSREGRAIRGFRLGSGPTRISLIAGCHADEPVGPALLDRLVAYLAELDARAPLLAELSWSIVPHVNPDGAERNRTWSTAIGKSDAGASVFDLGLYLKHVAREPPGDDIEFGFPRGPNDSEARPENRAVAEFLRAGAPFGLHGSFHGMAFAAGPWFLLEPSWVERTAGLRETLRAQVSALGYRVHDVDRRGEKGFHRIDAGFSTRPDSRAMAEYFLERGDPATAGLFRPSSMEFVRALGGDPLTLVSEVPLFLLPGGLAALPDAGPPAAIQALRARAAALAPEALAAAGAELGLAPMPLEDQMRLQLAFLNAALALL